MVASAIEIGNIVVGLIPRRRREDTGSIGRRGSRAFLARADDGVRVT